MKNIILSFVFMLVVGSVFGIGFVTPVTPEDCPVSLNWVSPIEIDFSIEGEADTLWVIWHVENLTGETGEIAVEFPRWEGHDGVSYNNGFRRSQVFSGLIIKEIEYVVVRGNETERYKYAYE